MLEERLELGNFQRLTHQAHSMADQMAVRWSQQVLPAVAHGR